MFQHLKHVGKEYKILIVKMVVYYNLVESTKANLLNSCGIDTILGLQCILPMLEFVNALMKFTHTRDVFVDDDIVVIKIC
jgi:hypothetical protein